MIPRELASVVIVETGLDNFDTLYLAAYLDYGKCIKLVSFFLVNEPLSF